MDKAEEKRQQIEADKLNAEFSVKLLKRELIVLNNVLVQTPFKVGDLLAILPILDKIRPFVVDAMMPPPGQVPVTAAGNPNHVVTSTKETPTGEPKEVN